MNSAAIAYVYQSIGKNTPTRPGHKLPNKTGIYRNWSPPPVVAAAFAAITSKPRTIKAYTEIWFEWETWCDTDKVDPLGDTDKVDPLGDTDKVDPLDATHDEYQGFLEDRSRHWGKGRKETCSTVLAHVYRSIDKPNPARPPSSPLKWSPASPAAAAAFAAAGWKHSTVEMYGYNWVRWETWCQHHNIDPLDATHPDYRDFLADYSLHPTDSSAKATASALACVYRSIGKQIPTRLAVFGQDTSPSPVATAAFKAANYQPRTIRLHNRFWVEWQTWCDSHDVDPEDAVHDNYLAFVEARQHDWSKTTKSLIPSTLACVYRYISKPNPAHPPQDTSPASLAAQAAFQTARLGPNSIRSYRAAWNEWTHWCGNHHVDPLDAAHDDYQLFRAVRSPHWGKGREQQIANTLACVYRSIGKSSPARPVRKPPTDLKRDWLTRFSVWCEDHDKTPIPANPEDVIAFLTGLAQSYSTYDTGRARAAISWHNQEAGYSNLSNHPQVRASTAHLEDHYPTTYTLLPETIKEQDKRRQLWRNWCSQHHIDPLDATPDHICQYIRQRADRITRKTIQAHLRAISGMYDVNSPTEADKVKEAVAAIPQTIPAAKRRTTIQQEVEEELQYILNLTDTQLLWENGTPPHVTPEQLTRMKQAMMAGEVTNNTMDKYIRTGWLPFKRWCATNGTDIEKAEPGDITVFLCDLADNKSPKTAQAARDALSYCYRQFRPLDNPAENKTLLRSVRGLHRENPIPVSQMDPITEEEMELIRATAYTPKHRERPHQTRLRAAVDVALIATMRDAMTRRNETSEARWRDIEENANGSATLTIRRSKTDQLAEGADAFISIPTMDDIRTMKHEMRQAGIQITPDDTIFRMGPAAVAKRIKSACERAGLNGRYAGHSPRIGMTQDLVANDQSNSSIMHAARWDDPRMPAYYARKLQASRNAVSRWHARKKTTPRANNPNPLAAYGLVPPHGETRMGH